MTVEQLIAHLTARIVADPEVAKLPVCILSEESSTYDLTKRSINVREPSQFDYNARHLLIGN